MTSGSNLKRAATEGASSIGPAYQVTSPNLQQLPPEEGNDSIGRQIVAQTQNINHPTGMETLMPVFCAVMSERFIWNPDDAGGLSGGAAVSHGKRLRGECGNLSNAFLCLLTRHELIDLV